MLKGDFTNFQPQSLSVGLHAEGHTNESPQCHLGTVLVWISSHHLWVSSGMIDQRNTFIGDVSAGTKTQNSLSSCLACMQILQQQKPHFNMRAEEVIEGETFHRVLVDAESASRSKQLKKSSRERRAAAEIAWEDMLDSDYRCVCSICPPMPTDPDYFSCSEIQRIFVGYCRRQPAWSSACALLEDSLPACIEVSQRPS